MVKISIGRVAAVGALCLGLGWGAGGCAKVYYVTVTPGSVPGETPDERTMRNYLAGYAQAHAKSIKEHLDAKLSGTTVVEIDIDAQGTIREARLVESSGHALLDREAVEVWHRVRDSGMKLYLADKYRSSGVLYRYATHFRAE